MQFTFLKCEDFIVCQTADGFRIHAPFSTDKAIANGEAPYLVAGPGEPSDADFLEAARKYVPWAAELVPVNGGGFMAFESVTDAQTWKAQISK